LKVKFEGIMLLI